MRHARVVLATLMYCSAFFLPWWVGALIGLILAVRYRAWEVVLFGALLDVLWLPSGFFFGLPLATCIALTVVWMLEPLRRQFMFDYAE